MNELVRWMGAYGIIQGLKTDKGKSGKPFKNIVAETAMRLYETWGDRDAQPDRETLQCRFVELNRSIGNSFPKDRSFISIPSKLLWLQNRTVTPIYDRNASIAINVLHKLLKSLDDGTSFDPDNKDQKRPRQVKNSTARERDVASYDHFCAVYYSIYKPLEDEIFSKMKQENCNLEPIRFFGRILWIMGSQSEDFGIGK